MAKYLSLWHMNPFAPWPKDPVESEKLREKMWAGIDDLLKKGIFTEFGIFLNGTSGYVIGEADGAEVLKDTAMFMPYYTQELHEVIPYEKGKGIIRAVARAQAEMMKK